MSTAKPSNGPLFAMSATNRTSIGSSLRTSGFPAGAIIPSGENNEIDYEQGQWLDFMRSGGGQVGVFGASIATYGESSGITVTHPFLSPATSGATALLKIENTSGVGGTLIYKGSSGPVFVPGTVTNIIVDLGTVSGTHDITVSVFGPQGVSGNPGGSVYAIASASISSSDNNSSKDLGAISGTANILGPFEIVIEGGLEDTESLEIAAVRLTLS